MRAFGDWWVFSMADVHIGPGSSGYSRTAFAYGLHERMFFIEPFEGLYWYGCNAHDSKWQVRIVACRRGGRWGAGVHPRVALLCVTETRSISKCAARSPHVASLPPITPLVVFCSIR